MEDLKLVEKQKEINKEVGKMTKNEVDLLWRNLKLMYMVLTKFTGASSRFGYLFNTSNDIGKRTKLAIVLLAMADEDE